MENTEIKRVFVDERGGDIGPSDPRPSREIAARVLERLRRDCGGDVSQLPSPAALERQIEAQRRAWSHGEDAWISELQELVEPILPRALGGVPAGRPVVVIDHTTSLFTARCQPIGGFERSYLIVLHRGLFIYTQMLLQAVIACLPQEFHVRPYRPADLDEHLTTSLERTPEETAMPFAEAAVYLAVDGHPGRPELRLGVQEQREAARTLRYATDLFVLGHEYAHFELGHDGPERAAIASLGARHVTDIHWRELQADEVGLSISSLALSGLGCPLEHASLGAWIFLSGQQAFELARSVLECGSAEDGTARYRDRQEAGSNDGYPTPRARKERLFRRLMEHSQGHNEVLAGLWSGYERVLDRLLAYTARYAANVPAQERPATRR